MTTLYRAGDRLEGEVIVCEGRKVTGRALEHGSGSHRIQQLRLRGNARCWIEVACKSVRHKPPDFSAPQEG